MHYSFLILICSHVHWRYEWNLVLFMTYTQCASAWCFPLYVFGRRLEWVGQSSSWWLMWRIWGVDMTETLQSWRRPRGRSSSRPTALSNPEHLQVSDTVCLVVSSSAAMSNIWLTNGFSCCRSRRQWQQKDIRSAGIQILGLFYHLTTFSSLQSAFYLCCSNFSPLDWRPSKNQCINHFRQKPGQEVSFSELSLSL